MNRPKAPASAKASPLSTAALFLGLNAISFALATAALVVLTGG